MANGDATALFVGATRILDRWAWDGGRLPVLRDDTIIETERGRQGVEAFDLEWLDTFEPYTERILIRWRGPIAWSQWAHRGEREILELRIDAREPAFPGFSAFSERVANLAFIPQAWRAALGSVRGVYLLVAGDGSQYVGSAAGQDGFMGRWDAYAANGHGGNVILRQRGDRDYAVSILEIASPDMSRDEIIAREVFWKQKLGARAHGLNAN
ncbi:GIY-YIG nuclease family protein [Amaricoccus sp. W119]|uniref:GIY-YIG nuclease family protein n=1 Tax=Amaricoccus sp. W119 TaxID=3391833 RepID=UPI0039A4B793